VGWYRVIKTVKGRQYAYLQRSWRDGKRVRTQSISLGPVSGGGGSAAQIKPEPPAPLPQDDQAVITTIQPTNPTAPTPYGLQFRFDPEKAKVSVARLESDHSRAREWAVRLGVPAERFPGLVVASGSTLSHRRARFSNNMVVFIPKAERNRSAIRREVHKATARAMLDGLRECSPARFASVAGAMDASFRETNRLLFGFLSRQDGASKIALSLQVYAFGYISAQRGRFKNAPENLGIAGFGDKERRKSWEDEAVAILADAQGKGWQKISETQHKATSDAVRAEKAAMRRYLETRSLFDRFTGKRRLMRKRFDQAAQVRQLCEEAERKTTLFRSVLESDR
jgi:hypothetical protein